jgi:DNA repair exonuclease SbcCD nuclease subunit
MLTIKLQHDKVNLVWTTDWHFTARPPGRRTDNYQESLLTKLSFVSDLVYKVKGVGLCGGDVFHDKHPKSPSNSVNLLVDLISTLRGFPNGCVYGSVGNHDLSWDRMDTLPHQPLGILIASGAYHNLNEAPVIFTNSDESLKVSVETFPYANGDITKERLLNSGARQPGVNYRVGIVHAYGHPGNSGSMFGEPKIGYNDIQDIDFDFLFWGHDHSRKETETVGNVTHVNLGSMARAALDYDEADRPVVAAIVSFAVDGVRYKEKEIPVKPLEIAFVTADKAMDKVAKSDEVAEFFTSMDEQVDGIESTDPIDILKQLSAEDKPLLDLVMGLCGL